MSTMLDEDFDYQTYMRENPPDLSKIQRGPKARRRRLEAAMNKISVRIEKDIFDQFEKIATPDQDSGKLINNALREWLAAKDIKKLVRTELRQMIRDELASFQADREVMKVADEQSPYKKQ
ncbi:MAG: hypothetical protein MUC94_18980 [bacterium]|nr:hypothetical protein [bacterium]